MKGGGPTNLGLLPINFFFDPIPVDLPFLVVVMMMMMDDLAVKSQIVRKVLLKRE